MITLDLKLVLFVFLLVLLGVSLTAVWLDRQWRPEEVVKIQPRPEPNFVGALAHELRTPLTAILAHLGVVQQGNLPPETEKQSLAIAYQEALRLKKLTEGFLQLGRLETTAALELRPVDLVLVAEATVAELILAAEAQEIELNLLVHRPVPRVAGDADQLQQLLLILLDNALKYCPPYCYINLIIEPQPAGVLVKVTDTGPGITAEDVPHVQKRLYRGRSDKPGSGLGLAIAAEITRHHHTALTLTSQTTPPAGTTVSFLLPLA